MCEYCGSDPSCTHPVCSVPGSACACSLSGPPKCPTCGHECYPWFFGMGMVDGPEMLRDFLGAADTENPGFSDYPVTKAQLLAALRERVAEIAEDGGTASYEVPWLEQHLPDGTYRDPGELFAALTPVLEGPAWEGTAWAHQLPIGGIAMGTRLRVPVDSTALLVKGGETPLDLFPPGEHVLSPQTAPLAAAASRRPAPGFPHAALEASVLFFSGRDQQTPVSYSGKSKSGETVMVQGSLRYWVQDPRKLVRAATHFSLRDSPSGEVLLRQTVQPSLDKTLSSLDASAVAADHSPVEASMRRALDAAGIGVRTLTLQSVGPPFTIGFPGARGAPGAMGGIPPEVLARMPPEARAMMEARMKEAQQRQAGMSGAPGSTPSSPPSMRPPGPPLATPGGAPSGAVLCAACHSPNPPTMKFCGRCGAPLLASRKCSACGHDVAPGIKFCGSCGTRMP